MNKTKFTKYIADELAASDLGGRMKVMPFVKNDKITVVLKNKTYTITVKEATIENPG